MAKESSGKARYKFRPSAIFRLFKRFRNYLKAHRKTMGFAFLCMIGATVMEILRPWPLKIIFDGILIPQKNPGVVLDTITAVTGNGQMLLAVSSIAILLVAVVGGLFAFGQAYLLASVGQKVVASIRGDLYGHIQRLSQSFHDTAATGDLLSRLTGDVRMMRDLLVTAVIFISARFLVVIGILVVMLLMDWRLTLVALSVLPMLGLSVMEFGTKIKGAARKQRRKEGKIAEVMAESISAIRVVQAYSRESFEDQKFAKQNSSSVKAGVVATRLEAHMDRLVQVILALGTCSVVWFGTTRVQAGVLTPGDLLVFTAYLFGLYKPIRKIASLTGRISKATVCGERILAILELEPDIKDADDAIEAPAFAGGIVFDRVDFAYVPGHDVLQNADLTVAPGETVSFVSHSGTGKSTIAHLITRFYDPQNGSVKIDGYDVRQFKLTSLRDQISILLQETVLFNATVRDNIAYGKLDASDQEIFAAAEAANAHEFIVGLPDGYDTKVGERGALLSGGQCQRVAIARAMVRNAPIIILDEPFTGLDASSGASVRQALMRLISQRTCIIITHDPATAAIGDRVLEIYGGRIQELPNFPTRAVATA